MTFEPSPSDKEELLTDHLPYEFEMMLDALRTLPRLPGIEQSRNLETVVIHARGLVYFFLYNERETGWKEKDAIPKDFLKEGETWKASEWSKDKKVWSEAKDFDLNKLPNLKMVNDNSSQEMAHLSYKRVPSDKVKTEWNLLGIVSEMFGVMRNFESKCKEECTEELKRVISDADVLFGMIKEERSKKTSEVKVPLAGDYSSSHEVTFGTSTIRIFSAVVGTSMTSGTVVRTKRTT